MESAPSLQNNLCHLPLKNLFQNNWRSEQVEHPVNPGTPGNWSLNLCDKCILDDVLKE